MNTLGVSMRSARVLVIGEVGVPAVVGLALIVLLLGRPEAGGRTNLRPVDALANSTDSCVTCHRRSTPGIVEQFGVSTMAAAKVTCQNCHEVSADYPGAVAHQGTHVLPTPTTARCQLCHQEQVAQYNQ